MSKFDAPKGARKSAGKASKPAGKRPAKSHKADGTPKKRWSAAERSERGHDPRRRGGQVARGSRDDRGRDDRARDDRGGYGKAPREERSPRWDDSRRQVRDEVRASRGFDSRDERRNHSQAGERPSNRAWVKREERQFADRIERSEDRYGRDDRPRRDFDRRDDRPRRDFDRRDDRPRRDFQNRDDRPRRDFQNRDDRPRRDFGDDRPRRDFQNRDERPRRDFERRDDRPRRDFDRRDWDERPRRDEHLESTESDNMEWAETELGDLDLAAVTSEDGFSQLGLPEQLVAALASQGITDPFPIQAATIPVALTGRDVLGRGRTGSGKTLAFGLPMLSLIASRNGHKNAPAGMVLVPTRELALQVADVLSPLARTLGLHLALVAGGMSYQPQIKAFERGVDIVVATPGRLIDLLEQGVADLSKVQVTVLDEADHMADLGFMPAVTTLLDAVPADGQRMLFSATLDGAVDRLVRRYLTDPSLHEVDGSKASVTTMEHRLLLVSPHHKNATTAAVANRDGRTVIFARTQMGASRVAEQLREAGVMAGALHGGLTQGARARMLAAFKTGVVPVLVATDVAARGIHVDDVSLVLQIDPPMNAKDYLHRAGRTARAGEKGVVATIVLPHQRRSVQRLVGDAGVRTEPISLSPDDDRLAELTGARPVSGESIAEDDFNALIAPKKTPRQSRPKGQRGGFGRERGGFGRGGAGRGGSGRDGGFRRGGGPRRTDRIAEPGGWN